MTFLTFYFLGIIVKSIIKKQRQKNVKNIFNPRDGNIKIKIDNDTELGLTISSCISDNKRYLVRNQRIRKLIFYLVKAKIKDESLVITPNMIRFLFLKVIDNDRSLIVKIGSVIASSSNRARLFVRLSGTFLIEFVGSLIVALLHTILMILMFLDTTTNCNYLCQDYFKQFPKEGPVIVYSEKLTGNLIIAKKND